jgi:hypothetical protein
LIDRGDPPGYGFQIDSDKGVQSSQPKYSATTFAVPRRLSGAMISIIGETCEGLLELRHRGWPSRATQ